MFLNKKALITNDLQILQDKIANIVEQAAAIILAIKDTKQLQSVVQEIAADSIEVKEKINSNLADIPDNNQQAYITENLLSKLEIITKQINFLGRNINVSHDSPEKLRNLYIIILTKEFALLDYLSIIQNCNNTNDTLMQFYDDVEQQYIASFYNVNQMIEDIFFIASINQIITVVQQKIAALRAKIILNNQEYQLTATEESGQLAKIEQLSNNINAKIAAYKSKVSQEDKEYQTTAIENKQMLNNMELLANNIDKQIANTKSSLELAVQAEQRQTAKSHLAINNMERLSNNIGEQVEQFAKDRLNADKQEFKDAQEDANNNQKNLTLLSDNIANQIEQFTTSKYKLELESNKVLKNNARELIAIENIEKLSKNIAKQIELNQRNYHNSPVANEIVAHLDAIESSQIIELASNIENKIKINQQHNQECVEYIVKLEKLFDNLATIVEKAKKTATAINNKNIVNSPALNLLLDNLKIFREQDLHTLQNLTKRE